MREGARSLGATDIIYVMIHFIEGNNKKKVISSHFAFSCPLTADFTCWRAHSLAAGSLKHDLHKVIIACFDQINCGRIVATRIHGSSTSTHCIDFDFHVAK
jgi:hypothetical protein